MEKNYEDLYAEIVKGTTPGIYKGPEHQGNLIEKCTILKAVEEIEYSNHSKIQKGYMS